MEGAGGFMGEKLRIQFEGATVVLKRLTQPAKLAVSRALGLTREAHFYQQCPLDAHLLPSLPRVYFAWADDETGERWVFMEDLAADGVQLGQLFGPGNPNNWELHRSGELERLQQRILSATAPDAATALASISHHVFRVLAGVHASCWNDPRLASRSWLRSGSWYFQPDAPGVQEQWTTTMRSAWEHWETYQQQGPLDESIWPPELVTMMTAAFDRATFANFLVFSRETPFTLVHGDCHPANMMWLPHAAEPLKLLDWEMVGVGSGPQELGQFVISHLEPGLRRQLEHQLVRSYYDELLARRPELVDRYLFSSCWSEYVAGGLGRWLWFLAWLSTVMGPDHMRFFCAQVLAFMNDHQITPASVPLPRI
jgi:hypothetical protein